MKKIFILLFFIVSGCNNTDFKKITIKTKNRDIDFNIKIAKSFKERKKGLMFIKTMPENQGMLFNFQTEQKISMWMKNTYIPLDMIFIKKTGQIAHIEKNTTPQSLKNIESKVAVKYVLEINAGLCDKHNIKIGNKVIIDG